MLQKKDLGIGLVVENLFDFLRLGIPPLSVVDGCQVCFFR